MAEVQRSTLSGEMALRFIEFVRMQSQNASFCLGLIAHPQTGRPQPNLPMAKLLIDQLAAIAYKTQGNLTDDEQTILDKALAQLQEAYDTASAEAKKQTA